MTKKEIPVIVEGGKANPGPPLGPALGPLGINTAEVVKAINEKTKDFAGMKVPVKVVVNTKEKTFEIVVESPYVSELLKKEAKIEKGASDAKQPAGDISIDAIIKIAKLTIDKGYGLRSRVKEVLGTAQSLGITVEGEKPKALIKEIDEGKFDSKLR